MPRYIKIYLDNKRRSKFKEKHLRAKRLSTYLGYTNEKIQKRSFKTYCQLTGAARSVYSQFAMSRHYLRKYANLGLVVGVKASSW